MDLQLKATTFSVDGYAYILDIVLGVVLRGIFIWRLNSVGL